MKSFGVEVERPSVAHVLATWFGCGHVPYAPGTAGTLGAVPLYLVLRPMGHLAVLTAALLITAIGIWVADVVAKDLGKEDPQIVVIDEVAGVLLTLSVAPPTWGALVAGVVLFRIFDQLKPWPARTAERELPGGWGIVLDDVAAGVWGGAGVLGLKAAGILG
jgi:phosphatidylglycerophosphatase A